MGKNVLNVTAVSASTYSVLEADYILHVTYTNTGAATVTIPTAQVEAGRILHIKDADFNANANNITVATGGSEKIDGNATYTISTDGGSVSLYSDGTDWFVY